METISSLHQLGLISLIVLILFSFVFFRIMKDTKVDRKLNKAKKILKDTKRACSEERAAKILHSIDINKMDHTQFNEFRNINKQLSHEVLCHSCPNAHTANCKLELCLKFVYSK